MRQAGQKVRLVPRNDILLTTGAYDPTGLAITIRPGQAERGSGVEGNPPSSAAPFPSMGHWVSIRR